MNWNPIICSVATAVIAYLLGSFSPAIVFTRLAIKEDIRTLGSGNAGFTNVLRSVGVGPAALTIICDFLKGVVAVLIGWWLFASMPITNDVARIEYVKYAGYLAGAFVVIGHSFPVYYKFKGGKGVTTAAAAILVIDYRVFLLILATFLIIFLCTKLVSLGSIACAALFPVYTCLITYFCDYLPSLGTENEIRFRFVLISTGCALVIGQMIIVRHHSNIQRLLAGQEKKLKVKKNPQVK